MVRCLEAAVSMQVIGIDSATSAIVLDEVRKERKHPSWVQFRDYCETGDGLVVHW